MARLGKREIYEGLRAFLCLKRKWHKAGQEPSEIEQDVNEHMGLICRTGI